MDATYVDRSNMRNRVSFDVWNEIQQSSAANGFDVLHSSSLGHLCKRWFELRKDVLSHENLLSHFHNYEKQISGSGAVGREKHRWPGALDDIQTEIEYIENWTTQRLSILDGIFGKMQ